MNTKQTCSILATLISSGCLFASSGAMAQGIPLACQVEAAGGLKWEGGKRNVAAFQKGKFILVLDDNNIQQESASKAMHLNAPVKCAPVSSKAVSCFDNYGGYLYFSPNTLHGTIARLDADNDSQKRDTISVEAFSCQKFN